MPALVCTRSGLGFYVDQTGENLTFNAVCETVGEISGVVLVHGIWLYLTINSCEPEYHCQRSFARMASQFHPIHNLSSRD